MTLNRFGLGVGALFIVVLVVVAAVMASFWLMQFGLSHVFTSTSVTHTYSSRDEFRANIDLVEGSKAWKVVNAQESPFDDHVWISFKYTLRNTSDQDIVVGGWSDLMVQFVDADGFAVWQPAKGTDYVVPANSEFTFTLVDNVEKAIADQIADMRIDGPD
ncbi:MAG: hypothetical protein OXO54_09270 [Chloroflexota bacterium]|nr:hypothetical protein [Chloroflexota bacterium]MDE2898499.1 hypothetical protein [Chloroflexota bacterium]